MKQCGLTILSPIKTQDIKDLDTVLRQIGDDVANQTHIRFGDLALLHFASWVVFADGAPGPQLIFESNFDGSAEAFLRQLIARARSGLDEIYRHCEDYPLKGNDTAVYHYLRAHIVNTDTFYVSCGGFTCEQIVRENQLHTRIESFLGTIPKETKPAAIREMVQDFVTKEPELAWARQPAESYPFLERVRARDFVLVVVLLAALFGPLFLGGKVWLAWMALIGIVGVILWAILRSKERADPSISDLPVEDAQPNPAQVDRLTSRENRRPQNHLASTTVVKPGIFRFVLLKVVLALIELLGRLKYYKGSLGGIPSIHFARWTVINDGKYLLFLSNFDGSWEHYLGEFIDQAAHGLTAVWSNTVNFPRSWNLIEGGAADEQRFKDIAREHQLYTQLWYSAYPFLSVVNVQNNAAIHAQLWGKLERKSLEAWLKRF